MKKYIIYIGILVVGLLLGWLLFGRSTNNEVTHDHKGVAVSQQMWTCSMHPQIMQPEPGDCPICGMELIPVELSTDGLLADQFKLTENAMALANIQTTVVGKGTKEDQFMKLSGKIVENEEDNTVQVSYFSGRVERLNISFTGETIRKGQLLANIYAPELYAAQQELITTASLKGSQPELYRAVRNKLKLWKLSEIQIDEIEETGKIIENFPVYATVAGTVTEKLVEQGDYIKQGMPLFKIAKLQSVWANFDVYETEIDQFKKGQKISITTPAYPNREIEGSVSFIDPILNMQTRTVTLRVVLNNQDHVFKPGMFVEGKVKNVMPNSEEMLSIPATAVLWTGERSVVYLKSDPKAPVFEMREVTLGNKVGDQYLVVEGLISGDEIVTHGAFTVDAAAQLQGKKSMMNKEGDKTGTGHEGHSHTEDSLSPAIVGTPNKNQRIAVPKDFQEQLSVVFDHYISLKDALVQDDAKKVKVDAKQLLNSLGEVNMTLLSDQNAHTRWMSLKKGIETSADAIANTTRLKEQRIHFKQMSSQMIHAVQLFGVNEKVYVEFCPMADNNSGGYWLSREEKVINPYFGDAMLSCGEIKQVIE